MTFYGDKTYYKHGYDAGSGRPKHQLVISMLGYVDVGGG